MIITYDRQNIFIVQATGIGTANFGVKEPHCLCKYWYNYNNGLSDAQQNIPSKVENATLKLLMITIYCSRLCCKLMYVCTFC